MKVHLEIDCTPEEARSFMGLPDVGKANDIYIDAMTKAMQGVSSPDQLEQYARQLAPMGQVGLKLFQSFVEGATGGVGRGMGGSGGSGSRGKPGPKPDKSAGDKGS